MMANVHRQAVTATSRLQKEAGRVFVAMPFSARHAERFWKIVSDVCDIYGLKAERADSPWRAGSIPGGIAEAIGKAEIVIADLSGHNPNVLEEVGRAQALGASLVPSIRKEQEIPFNLAQLRCIFFDLDTQLGQIEFAKSLFEALDDLRRVEPPILIRGVLERTRQIIMDLQTLGQLPDIELRTETVWYSGAFSSLAISPREGFPHEEQEYHNALLDEKETLLSLARRGCLIRCVITPPSETAIIPATAGIARHRVECLLELLESSDKALDNIEWAVSPFRQNNLYIIGHVSCLVGYKDVAHQRGYGLTLRHTGIDIISANISVYEELFEQLSRYVLGPDMRVSCKALRDATIKSLDESLDFLGRAIAVGN